jgi:molecular chaperone DnaK (HSP70)
MILETSFSITLSLNSIMRNNTDTTKDVKAIKGLRSEVEKAEQAVLTKPSAKIEVLISRSSHRFSTTITQTALDFVKHLLENAKMEQREIDGIIITGNPTHIARDQPHLQAYLEGKERKAFRPPPTFSVPAKPSSAGLLYTATYYLSSDNVRWYVTAQRLGTTLLGLGMETGSSRC